METMILETSPKLSKSSIIVSLWGICEEPSRFPTRMVDFEDYLDVRYRNSVVREIIDELWQRIESPPPQVPPYALYFLESEVFSAKNPTFSYHHEIVEELKDMFHDVVRSDPWAVSLSDLQKHLLQVYINKHT